MRSFLISLLIFGNFSLQAEVNWPAAKYDSSIPSIEQVLGYKSGERISSHQEMLSYFKALEKAAPERIKLVEYARTWQNRALIYAVIGSEEQLSKLAEYEQGIQQLSNPEGLSSSDASRLLENLPSAVWLGYGVHGNEISSTDAAMMTAYHLLASQNDPVVDNALANTLVFIDPLQNPDGRERFTSRYYATVTMSHSDDRYSAEHNEPWPRGRSNHYLFDMNRDWLAMTQPETKGRISAMLKYRPQVVIDLHEMGGDMSYYFAPPARPLNPYMTETQMNNIALVGKSNGEYFDRFGFPYFTREIFDAFYPGYGDSWPAFYGAAASTYEVASSRGEVYRRADGSTYTYADSVQQHFVASVSTIDATAKNRAKLIRDYLAYQRSAIELGKDSGKERVYMIPADRDPSAAKRLADLLVAHGVRVSKATESFKQCNRNYSAGSYLVDSAQPRARFIKTVLSKQVDIAEDFMQEQERRRARKLHHELYDVTAWSLPLMFNVDVGTCNRLPGADSVAYDGTTSDSGINLNKAKVAYLVPWGELSSISFLSHALQAGIDIKSANKAFTIEGKRYPAGTLIIETASQKNLHDQLVALATKTRARVTSVDTSWVTDGPSFGSPEAPKLIMPKVAMAWDTPTSSLSAGNTRFVIEREFGLPVTAIRANQLSSRALERYDVLILPSGYYSSSSLSGLKDWVQAGGTLITLGRATRSAAGKDAGLLALKRENAVNAEGATEAGDEDTVDGSILETKDDFFTAIESANESPDSVPGVLAKVKIDTEHWLNAGVSEHVYGMVTGSDIFSPIKLTDGNNLAWYAEQQELLASGYLWKENLKQLAFKPFMVHQSMGRGMVIGFTQDIAVRAYLEGLYPLLANAVLRAPAQSGKLR